MLIINVGLPPQIKLPTIDGDIERVEASYKLRGQIKNLIGEGMQKKLSICVRKCGAQIEVHGGELPNDSWPSWAPASKKRRQSKDANEGSSSSSSSGKGMGKN